MYGLLIQLQSETVDDAQNASDAHASDHLGMLVHSINGKRLCPSRSSVKSLYTD